MVFGVELPVCAKWWAPYFVYVVLNYIMSKHRQQLKSLLQEIYVTRTTNISYVLQIVLLLEFCSG